MHVERRLAAIMVADIVGFSSLIEADEVGTLAAIKSLRSDAIDPVLAEHRGRIVKLLGDGFIVEFGSVVDAVASAVAIQQEVASRQSRVPSGRRIVFRIGINLGDVVVEEGDLLGDGVNVAARLEQICAPGGVLVSGTAYDHLQGKLDLPLQFIGEQRVKNIARPVRAYQVKLTGTGRGRRPLAWKRRRPSVMALLALAALMAAGTWWLLDKDKSALHARPAIAVLPFESIGGDETTKRFASGITEDIITDLARYRELDVIAHNSTVGYSSSPSPSDIMQISQVLNVRYVLEGSVQQEAGHFRVTAVMLDAKTAAHLWSERWDRPVGDLLVVQAEISDRVTNRLANIEGVILAAEHIARRKKPEDLSAYALYLQGREALQHFTRESIAEAVPLLKQAVQRDPTLARAWVELAGALTRTIDFGAEAGPVMAEALAAAKRAVELDPQDALAHALLGNLLGAQGDFQHAQAELETALRLNPGSTDVMTIYVSWASGFGQPERGVELADRVIRLDPDYPTWAASPFSYAYFMIGRYQDALHVLERQSTENYTIYSWVLRAASNAALGNDQQAALWVDDTLKQFPDLTIQGFVSEPGWNEAERDRLSETMQKAGFPACANSEQLKKIARPFPLSGC